MYLMRFNLVLLYVLLKKLTWNILNRYHLTLQFKICQLILLFICLFTFLFTMPGAYVFIMFRSFLTRQLLIVTVWARDTSLLSLCWRINQPYDIQLVILTHRLLKCFLHRKFQLFKPWLIHYFHMISISYQTGAYHMFQYS